MFPCDIPQSGISTFCLEHTSIYTYTYTHIQMLEFIDTKLVVFAWNVYIRRHKYVGINTYVYIRRYTKTGSQAQTKNKGESCNKNGWNVLHDSLLCFKRQ